MFTLTQIQSIFDYGMLAYSQAFQAPRKEAIQHAAKAAAAATTVANAEAKMADKVKQVFLVASMEATIFNAHLTDNAHRVAFDKCLASNFKRGLEHLFEVNDIKLNEKQSFIYGKGYFLMGLYHEAIATLTTAMDEDSFCIAEAYYYLGKSNACIKNHIVARTYFNTLINFPMPNNPSKDDRDKNQEIRFDAWLNRAASLRKIGAFKMASGSLAMARDLSPNDATLLDETKALSATIIQHQYHFFKQTKALVSSVQASSFLNHK